MQLYEQMLFKTHQIVSCVDSCDYDYAMHVLLACNMNVAKAIDVINKRKAGIMEDDD